MHFNAIDLIDKLIESWSSWSSYEEYYLKNLAPAIVTGEAKLAPKEREIVDQLQELLSDQEWDKLPELIASRRAARIMAIESDRIRIKAERESLRLATEERRRREAERVALERKEAEDRQRYEAECLRREEELNRKRQKFKVRARAEFEIDFLAADRVLSNDPGRILFSEAEYLGLKSEFVQAWANKHLKLRLDLQQAAAVGAVGGDFLVVARAGAGKTRILVTRALFLQQHCGVSPRNLLLLAFNKDAANEMRERLLKSLGNQVPHVMTFHALAYALVRPEEDLIYDEPSVGNLGLSSEIQLVIDEHLQSDEYRPLIRDLMLLHFCEDWESIVRGGFDLPIKELVRYRSMLPRESLRGEYVKSFGERLIANTLFSNDIDYKYERNFRWNGINYKPDFTVLLPEGRGIVVEYFGLVGDRDYDRMSQEKRIFWSNREGWSFIELSPTDIVSRGVDGFADLLLEKLAVIGVKGRELSEEEIWQRIRRRAVDNFTGAMSSFVSRCRKGNLSIDDLRHEIDRHTPINQAERLFLQVGASVYSGYLQRLTSSEQEDFNGLMWRAVACLETGEGRFKRDRGRERGDIRNIRFVLIDEFQDFSEMFYSMSKQIRTLGSVTEFFCVGDDWQAINGFAGSDLRFFEEFSRFFPEGSRLRVTTNYRSPNDIVGIGNALMHKLGEPAISNNSPSGWVKTAQLSDFTPAVLERTRHSGDEVTPALLRLVRHILDTGLHVVMLSRRNDVPWFVSYTNDSQGRLRGLERFIEHVRSFLPEHDRKRVTASTSHQYKGLEKDAVIIVDADARWYPLIHPNWVFLRLFGDTIQRIMAEEQRLFYVALTRSRHSLVILSEDESCESPYLSSIKKRMRLDSVDWADFKPVPSLDGERVEVRVYNAYNVRDQLKEQGYRWNESGKCWCGSLPRQGFNFEALCAQSWARIGVRIKVYLESGHLIADSRVHLKK